MIERDRLNFSRLNPIKEDHSKRDPSKFYRYHRDIDHDTNECFDLKEEIEDLIRKGHLAQYTRRPRCEEQGRKQPQLEENPAPPMPEARGEIRIVFRGPHIRDE